MNEHQSRRTPDDRVHIPGIPKGLSREKYNQIVEQIDIAQKNHPERMLDFNDIAEKSESQAFVVAKVVELLRKNK